jgi:phosphoserine phosphatase
MNKFDFVCFDLDSTLVTIEGLDWLAEKKGKALLIKELTKQSMEGRINLEDAMKKKIKILSLSYKDLEELGEHYCSCITEGVEVTIQALKSLGKSIWIVTGNFYPAVIPIANILGIPQKHIVANTVRVSTNNKFVSINMNNPLLRNQGKLEVVNSIINTQKKKIAFVGDSIADMEVSQGVDLFIGFGGVVEREIVRRNAQIYINEPNMTAILKYLLTNDELHTIERSKNI